MGRGFHPVDGGWSNSVQVILYKFRTLPNERSRHLSDEMTRLVQQLTQSTVGDWTNLRAFVSTLI